MPACKKLLSVVFLLVLPLLVACEKKNEPGAGGPAGGQMPPAQVGVVTVQEQPIGLATELPGRLEASRVAQVRARVAGIVQKRLFVEGSTVKAGQPLFAIDAAPYQATAASAQAALQRSQATLEQAKALADRYKPLVEANAISKQEYVNAVAAQKTAEADVATSRASIRSAQINLGYASVVAPISGRIGRALVTEGALVGQGDATPLATVQQISPMYVNFTQSTTDLLRLRKAVASGQFKRVGTDGAVVRIVLEDGSFYDQPGRLLFSDVTVDPTTGQITLRAEVPNTAGLLLPGMYVRVRFEEVQTERGILLPQQAVTRGSAGDSVMVVAPDGKVTPRPVRIGTAVNDRWVVLQGLQPGEQVMVDGFQKLRGGAPVKAVPWAPSASGAAAAAGTGGAAPVRGPGAVGGGGAAAAGGAGSAPAGSGAAAPAHPVPASAAALN